MPRSRRTAPKPSCRSGRWRASMSTPPTNIVVTRNSVTSRAVDRSPDRTSATPTTPTAASAPWSSPPLRRVIRTSTAQHRVEGAVDAGGEVGVAAQHVGLAQARCAGRRGRRRPPRWRRRGRSRRPPRRPCARRPGAAGGGRRAKVASRGQREQEGRRPPGEGRDHPQRAGGEEGARGLPHAPAHQLADLPRVVVDAVEHLADRLLGELGRAAGPSRRRAGRRAAGPRRGRRSWPRWSWRRCRSTAPPTTHSASSDEERRRWRRRRGGRRPSSRGTPRPRRAATSRSRGTVSGRRTRRQSTGTRPGGSPPVADVVAGAAWVCASVTVTSTRRYVAAPTSRARFSCDPGARSVGVCAEDRHRGDLQYSRHRSGSRLKAAGERTYDDAPPTEVDGASVRRLALRPRTDRPRGAA